MAPRMKLGRRRRAFEEYVVRDALAALGGTSLDNLSRRRRISAKDELGSGDDDGARVRVRVRGFDCCSPARVSYSHDNRNLEVTSQVEYVVDSNNKTL